MERAFEPSPRETPAVARPRERAEPLLAFTPETILALQRSAGNQAVARAVTVELRKEPPPPAMPPAGDRATPENRHLAEEIDTVAELPDAQLQERRAVASNQVGRTNGAEHEKAVQSLDAIEYVASMRRIGPRKLDWKNYEYVRHDAGKRRAYLRGIVEEGVRESGSFEATVKNVPRSGGKELEADIELLQQDADKFAAEFRGQARVNAERMLRGSLHAIAGVLGSYGLPPVSAGLAAERILHGSGTEEEARNVVKTAKQDPAVDAPGRATHRMRLAEWVEHLKQRQAKVSDLKTRTNKAAMEFPMDGKGPKVQAHADLKRRLAVARTELSAAWIEAERAHPALAAYRGTTKELETIDLGTLDTAGVDDQMRQLLEHVLPKLANIAKANQLIKTGAVSPLALPAVVGLTRANMFVPNGSIRAGVVNDLAAKASRDTEPTWMIVASIALALVTLVPSGGTSLAFATGVAGASLAAYSAVKELKHHDEQESLYDTDLDRARALSQEEPSLTHFAIALISLGLEGLPLIHAFKLALDIKRLKMAGDDASKLRKAIAELNKIGKEKNAPRLGEEAAADAEKAAAKMKAPKPRMADTDFPDVEDLPYEDVDIPTGENIPRSKPETVKKVMAKYQSPEHVRQQVAKKIAQYEHGFDPAHPPVGWDLVQKVLELHPEGVNAELKALLPHAMAGLRDPELYGEVMAEAWAALRADRDMNSILHEMAEAQGGKTRVIKHERGTLTDEEFVKDVATQPEHIVDNPFVNKDHGAMTHLVQDLVLTRAFKRAGINKTASEFRQMIGAAVGETEPELLRSFQQFKQLTGERTATTSEVLWRYTYDSGAWEANQPEVLGPIFQELLDVR